MKKNPELIAKETKAKAHQHQKLFIVIKHSGPSICGWFAETERKTNVKLYSLLILTNCVMPKAQFIP